MDRITFFEELEKGNIARVYLFSGEEEYEKQRALRELRAKLLPVGLESLNESVLDGAGAQEICEICAQFPVMCDKRLVTVRDWAPILNANAKGGKQETDRLLAYIDDPAETCVLVLYLHGELPDKAFAQKLSTHGNVTHVVFGLMRDAREAEDRFTRALKPYGKRIAKDAVIRLTEMKGMQLDTLMSELDKLAAYSGDRKMITLQDVTECVTPAAEYRVYRIMDLLVDGSGKEAFMMLDDAIKSGEKHIGLLSVFERQLDNMQQVERARDAGEVKNVTLRDLKMRPFQYDSCVRQLAKLKKGSAARLYIESTDAEYAVKSGNARQESVVEKLMLHVLESRRQA